MKVIRVQYGDQGTRRFRGQGRLSLKGTPSGKYLLKLFMKSSQSLAESGQRGYMVWQVPALLVYPMYAAWVYGWNEYPFMRKSSKLGEKK
jgi:hypothetical protein